MSNTEGDGLSREARIALRAARDHVQEERGKSLKLLATTFVKEQGAAQEMAGVLRQLTDVLGRSRAVHMSLPAGTVVPSPTINIDVPDAPPPIINIPQQLPPTVNVAPPDLKPLMLALDEVLKVKPPTVNVAPADLSPLVAACSTVVAAVQNSTSRLVELVELANRPRTVSIGVVRGSDGLIQRLVVNEN